jgi:hypothetical protein
MDYIYSIDLSSYINNHTDENGSGEDELERVEQLGNKCALSNRNLLAFSSDCYIYMLPLEKPNELIPVNLSNSVCTHLVWSDDGQYLLNAFKNKTINLYHIKVRNFIFKAEDRYTKPKLLISQTNLLNSVESILSFQTSKDDNVLAIKSFNKSPKVLFFLLILTSTPRKTSFICFILNSALF